MSGVDDRHSVTVDRVSEGVYEMSVDLYSDDVTVAIALALDDLTELDASTIIEDFSVYADPDALNRLFARVPDRTMRDSEAFVTLDVQGYSVTVYSDGRITLGEHHV